MLYPEVPAANFFPSSATKPIEPIVRAHEKFRSPVKSTPARKPPARPYYPDSAQSRFTPSHGPTSFAGTIVPPKTFDYTFGLGSVFTSAKKMIFNTSSSVNDQKMPASEIPIQSIPAPDFDMFNVSLGGGGFDSHDELSVIEPVQVHDDLPTQITHWDTRLL